jgi:hypothetical protein
MPFYSKNPKELFEQIRTVAYNWDECPEVTGSGKFLPKAFSHGLSSEAFYP